MNATELRIGNYVEKSLKSGNGRKRFDKIRICDIQHIYENDGSFNYNPIPLTEEILLKCGFHELNEFENTCIDKENFIEISSVLEDEFYIGKNKETGFYHFLTIDTFQGDDLFFKIISAQMQYLHTLQNYYPTFKGEELEINL